MKYSRVFFLLSIFLTGCVGVEKMEPVKGLQFPDEIRLDNGKISIGFTPSVGRITHFSKSGCRNLLWLNTEEGIRAIRSENPFGWLNYGGDRLWPEIQNTWRQTQGKNHPDPWIDGGRWRVLERSRLELKVRSEVSPTLGIFAERRIRLSPDASMVRIENVLNQERVSPYPVQLWSITQIYPAECYYLHLRIRSDYPLPGGYKIFSDEWGKIAFPVPDLLLSYRRPSDTTSKIGSYGDYLGAVTEQGIFLQYSPYQSGHCYPDGAAAEVFTRPEYSELEFLGGLRHLRPGERFTHTVTWQLLERPVSATERTDAERIRIAAETLRKMENR